MYQNPRPMRVKKFLITKGICPEKRIELVHGQDMLLADLLEEFAKQQKFDFSDITKNINPYDARGVMRLRYKKK